MLFPKKNKFLKIHENGGMEYGLFKIFWVDQAN